LSLKAARPRGPAARKGVSMLGLRVLKRARFLAPFALLFQFSGCLVNEPGYLIASIAARTTTATLLTKVIDDLFFILYGV
jgi:hypothetical protein